MGRQDYALRMRCRFGARRQWRNLLRPSRVEGRHRSSKLFYVPDGIAPWPDQPVRWVLEYSLGFFGGRRTFADQVIADLALAPLMSVPIRALSKGQRKRTLLALGLLAPQPILLIDEPFEGLDLRQSREAAATLRKHLTPDRTFFLSIHQIADAAKVCDRFVLLSGGRVVAEGALDMLTALARQRPATTYRQISRGLPCPHLVHGDGSSRRNGAN